MLEINPITMLWTVINLLFLCVAFKFVLFKPVQKIIDERQKLADKDFEEAAKAKEAADETKSQYEASLANAESEKKEILHEARKNADDEYQKIVGDAQNEAKAIKKKAVADAESQKEQILKSAEKEIADMVVSAATKVVAGNNGEGVDASLYNEFLEKAGE
jgi:F-type H+-transporting ATPase subunit b